MDLKFIIRDKLKKIVLSKSLPKSLHKIYFLNNFCCICMNKSDLKKLSEEDSDGVSHYNKMISSIAEMNFKEMNDQRLICGECCVTLNIVYTFRQTCLRSKTNLITYVSQLRTSSQVSGTLSVRLTDIKHETEVAKEKVCIKHGNKASSSRIEESNPLNEYKTESYEESIQFPASVEEESEDSSAHEDATVDHVNEEQSNVKVKVEHQTKMEDELYLLHTEIDIKEDPLAVVKEEPTSDSETPQDGSTSPRPHKCVICEKSYNRKSVLRRHMLVHSERKYACDRCKMRFFHRGHLSRHMRVHTGEKPCKCKICKKKFTTKATMMTHMRSIHFGEKPFECEVCEKKFSIKKSVNIHMRVHCSEFIPYVCQICDRTFNQKCNLKVHMRRHYGERPYECEICKERFFLKDSLTRHMKDHVNKTLYKCSICLQTFNFRCALNRHMKNMHISNFQHEVSKNCNQTGNLIRL